MGSGVRLAVEAAHSSVYLPHYLALEVICSEARSWGDLLRDL